MSKERSLEEFAWRIAGVREAIINVSVNSVIPAAVYWSQSTVPIWGWHGLINVLGPMSILLTWLTTFFGVLAGSLSRIYGPIRPQLAKETPWKNYAFRLATLRTMVVSPMVILTVYGLSRLLPHAEVPKWNAVAGLAIGSAMVAYFFHATAILATHRFDK
jgi:uncharacterized BrkB/YihY/UPF0761 family membrane protein